MPCHRLVYRHRKCCLAVCSKHQKTNPLTSKGPQIDEANLRALSQGALQGDGAGPETAGPKLRVMPFRSWCHSVFDSQTLCPHTPICGVSQNQRLCDSEDPICLLSLSHDQRIHARAQRWAARRSQTACEKDASVQDTEQSTPTNRPVHFCRTARVSKSTCCIRNST